MDRLDKVSLCILLTMAGNLVTDSFCGTMTWPWIPAISIPGPVLGLPDWLNMTWEGLVAMVPADLAPVEFRGAAGVLGTGGTGPDTGWFGIATAVAIASALKKYVGRNLYVE